MNARVTFKLHGRGVASKMFFFVLDLLSVWLHFTCWEWAHGWELRSSSISTETQREEDSSNHLLELLWWVCIYAWRSVTTGLIDIVILWKILQHKVQLTVYTIASQVCKSYACGWSALSIDFYCLVGCNNKNGFICFEVLLINPRHMGTEGYGNAMHVFARS